MKHALNFLVTTILVATSTFCMAAREVGSKDFSGWMESYDSLTYDEERNAFLFFNEERRGAYQRILLEDLTVFSKSGEADIEIANQATDYLLKGVTQLLERKGIAATEPGPGVLRLKIAITGVEKSKEGLKVYNFVPVAAVFRGAQAATGKVATYIDTMFEAEMVDSLTEERVAAIVTKGIEETEKRSGDSLTFEDVKPTLDKWLSQYEKTLNKLLQ